MNSCNTTIEPRLIALLNDTSPTYTDPAYIELPPLQKPSISKTLCRPPHHEPATGELKREKETSLQLNSSQTSILLTVDDESSLNNPDKRLSNSRVECTIGDSSRQSLSKILDVSDCGNLNLSKKINTIDSNKDDFVQLPRPTKKQKTTKQVVPPIIIGLYQPPPQSTLFPPITSSCFHDSHGRNSLNTVPLSTKLPKRVQENKHDQVIARQSTVVSGIKKQKNVATRKKWTEEETNNLLFGVHKHGVGCWADILNDSSFVFNERSSSDLKDRWRTCCPDELRKRASTGIDGMKKVTSKKMRSCLNSDLNSDDVFIHDESKSNETNLKTNSITASRKKRSHRKKLEDLFRLGIKGPIRQSSRRERRQFTEEEDCAILQGYKTFGPAWSKIQKDPRLNLQSRQPTDLRDRFRNKFKDKFLETKRSNFPLVVPKKFCKNNNALNIFGKDDYVGVNQVFTKNNDFRPTQSTLQSFPSRDGLRIQEIISTEPFNTIDQPSIDSVENLPFNQFTDWSQSSATSYSNIIGEMDISRLIIDQNWSSIPQSKEKQASLEVNNLLLTGSESFHQLPSFFSISNEVDDLTGPPFS
ncbi:hypothetical protein EPUL_002553 [Erysiphe pulchra]|uniref:Myb-like domain-containing protein n=1 Tax=Erysiphe pulchra TaxID=225359 RepID=A0A2S4PZ19_9PEZI|nr:hypothetical protein EPUL_002553 [Erysiphe pulchra]